MSPSRVPRRKRKNFLFDFLFGQGVDDGGGGGEGVGVDRFSDRRQKKAQKNTNQSAIGIRVRALWRSVNGRPTNRRQLGYALTLSLGWKKTPFGSREYDRSSRFLLENRFGVLFHRRRQEDSLRRLARRLWQIGNVENVSVDPRASRKRRLPFREIKEPIPRCTSILPQHLMSTLNSVASNTLSRFFWGQSSSTSQAKKSTYFSAQHESQ